MASGARNIIAIGCLWALVAFLPSVLVAEADETSAIQSVITAQLDAFLRDDSHSAFSYASPSIQAMFGAPDRFIAMVRSGYGPVYRSRTHRFIRLEAIGDGYRQFVLIEGRDGTLVTAIYDMVHIDGQWRISGCRLLRGNLT